jgi:hypothetical protein
MPKVGTRFWLLAVVVVGLVFGLAAGLGAAFAAPRLSAWASGVNAGLLAATFVAILWYSWETRRLLDSQQESGEIARHPWLSATTLDMAEVTPPPMDASYGQVRFRLRIDNQGQTPAYVKHIEVSGRPAPGAAGYRFVAREKPIRNQVIAPRDFLDLHLGTVSFTQPRRDYLVELLADIQYSTADGGAGSLAVGFRYADGGWINLDTTYKFSLSSGAEFPR